MDDLGDGYRDPVDDWRKMSIIADGKNLRYFSYVGTPLLSSISQEDL